MNQPTPSVPVFANGVHYAYLDESSGKIVPKEAFYQARDVTWEDLLEENAEAEKANWRTTTVYFIGADEGPIKIGFSCDPRSRMADLQTGCPVPLKLLAESKGGEEREKLYHYRFAAHRLHGEWFARHADILSEIERLNS